MLVKVCKYLTQHGSDILISTPYLYMDLDKLWGHINLDTMNVYNDTVWNSCQVNLLVSSLIAANTISYNCICSSYQSKSKMRVNPKKFTFLQLKKNCPSF